MRKFARLSLTAAAIAALLSAVPALAAEQISQPGSAGDASLPKDKTATAPPHGVPASGCRPGYVQQGFWLCMTGARAAASFANAMLLCMDSGGRVADYHDWRYRQQRGDKVPAPVGWWLGPITADNTALFVNQANVGDFDGETNRFELRNYACAHDLLR